MVIDETVADAAAAGAQLSLFDFGFVIHPALLLLQSSPSNGALSSSSLSE